jgi:demethylmenaquinone methyltransferase/2-methoxy-6-polyprenyl-1,4-benzoquinol methylase
MARGLARPAPARQGWRRTLRLRAGHDRTAATFGFRDVDPREAGLVRGVFDRVRPRYDLMNDLMSGGVHRLWKDAAAARLNPQPGEIIVDCAGGTGDMARRFARWPPRAAAPRRRGRQVLVIDYNAEMIAPAASAGPSPRSPGRSATPSACRCRTPAPTPM